jgi:hypothetical protein
VLRRLAGPPKVRRAHTVMRTALLGHLAEDSRVVAVFAGFPEVTDAAFTVGYFADAAARKLGLASGRQQLFAESSRFAFSERFRAALQAFEDRKRATAAPLRDALKTLVYDTWRRRWPWLVYELLAHHERLMNALAYGDGWKGGFSLPPAPPAAPPSAPSPQPGESLEGYERRISDFHHDLKRQLSRKPTEPRGGVQKNDARHRRDVDWFYRRTLKDPPDSLRVLARTVSNRPFLVKTGIARAERILSQGAKTQIPFE